ncbi:MAG TPA: hypothetical protein VMT76_01645 [Puia sp.]|nr:hypothetical protein [Puia sp.]
MEQQKQYVIAEEAQERIELALAQGRNWIAYDSNAAFLGEWNIHAFSTKGQAINFAALENDETEQYRVFHASSMAEVFRELPYGRELNNILSNQNKLIMNAENLEYLKENLKTMGFGDKLNKELELNVVNAQPEIQLKTEAAFNGQKMEAMLYFRKGEQNEIYFFNKYEATLENESQEKDRSQTFYLNRGYGITFKEAFNLLEGRAVNKDLTDSKGQKYNAWVQLDFGSKDKYNNYEMKQYHQNYGYDLEKALSKHPIVELENVDDRKMLISSLKKGNLQSVSFENDGVKNRMFIEANPKFKTISVYDQHKKIVLNESQKEEKVKEKSVDKEETKEARHENKQDKSKRRSKDELEPESISQKRARR